MHGPEDWTYLAFINDLHDPKIRCIAVVLSTGRLMGEIANAARAAVLASDRGRRGNAALGLKVDLA